MSTRKLWTRHLFTGQGEQLQNVLLKLNQAEEIVELQVDRNADLEAEKYEAICPGFINTHCHLELSHMHRKIEMHGGLHEFIPSLQSQRDIELHEIRSSIKEWDLKMQEEGIVAVADITNSDHSLEVKMDSPIYYHSFIELFGLREHKAKEIFEGGQKLLKVFRSKGQSASLSPHSPYSVSQKLFELISSEEKSGPITIHNQESEGEMELFANREGPLERMLLNYGNSKESIARSAEGSLLYALQFLNTELNTLLVHNTFSRAVDLEKATEMHPNLYWCFCPSANWYIEKRLPNIPLFIEKELHCTLGTDSLASNEQLSVLEEMKLIQKHYPNISTKRLMQWGCGNGAKFLGIDEGEILIGKKCKLNAIEGLDENGKLSEGSKVRPILQ